MFDSLTQCFSSCVPQEIPQHCASPLFLLIGISTLLHSSGIHSTINSLLNSLVKNFVPNSSMSFQTSIGNSSGPTALPFFHPSQCIFHFSTDTTYLFINHFCFLCPKFSVIFLLHQFLKILLPSL